ncbi:hypothetical protein MTO96_037293 [Rhipicephalus appendiculatus]
MAPTGICNHTGGPLRPSLIPVAGRYSAAQNDCTTLHRSERPLYVRAHPVSVDPMCRLTLFKLSNEKELVEHVQSIPPPLQRPCWLPPWSVSVLNLKWTGHLCSTSLPTESRSTVSETLPNVQTFAVLSFPGLCFPRFAAFRFP